MVRAAKSIVALAEAGAPLPETCRTRKVLRQLAYRAVEQGDPAMLRYVFREAGRSPPVEPYMAGPAELATREAARTGDTEIIGLIAERYAETESRRAIFKPGTLRQANAIALGMAKNTSSSPADRARAASEVSTICYGSLNKVIQVLVARDDAENAFALIDTFFGTPPGIRYTIMNVIAVAIRFRSMNVIDRVLENRIAYASPRLFRYLAQIKDILRTRTFLGNLGAAYSAAGKKIDADEFVIYAISADLKVLDWFTAEFPGVVPDVCRIAGALLAYRATPPLPRLKAIIRRFPVPEARRRNPMARITRAVVMRHQTKPKRLLVFIESGFFMSDGAFVDMIRNRVTRFKDRKSLTVAYVRARGGIEAARFSAKVLKTMEKYGLWS